jgi:acyl-CoA hydrolase
MKQSPDYLNVSEPKTTLHTFTVFPENLNYGGTLFGGKVLAEMDIAAVNTARRVLYNLDYDTIVTASLERVDFIAPGFLGDIIEMRSKLISVGRTSMDINVTVQKEDTKGKTTLICEAKFTFVVLKNGKALPHNLVLSGEIIPKPSEN